MDDQTKAAFTSVTDLTKQLITLATGVVAAQVSFTKLFYAQNAKEHWQVLASWALLLLSLAAGVWVLMAVAGTLSDSKRDLKPENVFDDNIRYPALVQVLLFVVGLSFSIWFGWISVSETRP